MKPVLGVAEVGRIRVTDQRSRVSRRTRGEEEALGPIESAYREQNGVPASLACLTACLPRLDLFLSLFLSPFSTFFLSLCLSVCLSCSSFLAIFFSGFYYFSFSVYQALLILGPAFFLPRSSILVFSNGL